ncbi:uncharacterized protein EV420DRAFT_1339458 [Desarmillaria tabescens]|uniref:F-box domain-containing protein n=1 Tax=Armillaria tabescens TaxID=1929756 RepID=A0AA39JRJ1_ARMTA|nr:uncharacterized protein EV420DRAFT_1339458 [Desarmillaria tabescens]KAK0446546.1 hypothetical protein EV420DRAFT_1339458 [Desarmillaria tabescens]
MADIDSSSILLCRRCENTISTKHPLSSTSVMEQLREGCQDSELLRAESTKRVLQDLKAKLLEYDSEISMLETTLSLLRNARNELKHSLSVHQSLFSPIRRLPIEILQAIFREACDIAIFPYQPTYSDLVTTSGTPLRLSSVCNHWRSVCLSTSELWTFHFVNMNLRHLPDSLRKLLSCYSNRSNSRLYTLSSSAITITDTRYREVEGGFREPRAALPELLDPFGTPLSLTRCHRIILNAGACFVPPILPSSLPALESVYISDYLEVTDDGLEVSRIFKNAPNLRELRLASVDIGMLDLPFHQIRTLWLQSGFYHCWNATSLLKQFTNLQHLTFFDDGIDVDPSVVSAPINIQSLCLFWAYNIPGIFTRFAFPCLTTLEVVDYGRRLPEYLVYRVNIESQYILYNIDVTSMIPSLSGLRELVLRNVVILCADVVRILDATQVLASLSIVERHEPQLVTITERLLTKLSDTERSLIRLEHVELVWAAENPVDEGAVMRVMDSRVGILKSAVVRVRGGGGLGKRTLGRMQSLRKRGLSISLF